MIPKPEKEATEKYHRTIFLINIDANTSKQILANKIEQYVKGFLSELGDRITPAEVELLPMSAKLMTLECGIRFLGDHLDGDVYFKIHREDHNLDRARTQFKMVADMEEKMDQMKAIVAKYAK